MLTLIIILGPILFGVLMMSGIHFIPRMVAKRKFDVHRVRELEMEIWGYYFTPAPEVKAKVNPPKHLPPANVKSQRKCHMCGVTLYSSNADTCQVCTQHILQKRRWEEEKKKRAENLAKYKLMQQERTSYVPRVRELDHNGEQWRAHMPSEVPDNAHAEIMESYKHGDFFGTWMVFKWTDQSTGRQMFLRSVANRMERYDIESMDGTVKRFYA